MGAAIDEEANGLSVNVAPGSGTDPSALARDLSLAAGVGVTVHEVVAGGDASCTSRDSCYSPMKAGNKVRDGSIYGANWCTQGFLVVKNGTSDVEFLTAGHCAWDGVGSIWYHQAYGLLGAEDGTAYGEDGYDVMKVQFPDAQRSALIYGVSGSQQLTASRSPIQNEGVCFSGAKTNAIVCGTVTAATATWVSQTCGCNVWGGDTNLAPIPGDSGSPLYARVYITGGPHIGSTRPSGSSITRMGTSHWSAQRSGCSTSPRTADRRHAVGSLGRGPREREWPRRAAFGSGGRCDWSGLA